MLRSALEVAFTVAVLGARQRPPLPAPPGLRPFLRFQKLPATALGPVRRAVEGDEEFRLRVASVANEDVVDRTGWLWLHRPAGWAEELCQLAAEEARADEAAAAEREERSARKRVDAAEHAARRAAAEAAAAKAGEEHERAKRREIESALHGAEQRLRQQAEQLDRDRRRAEEAAARIAALEAADVGARARVEELLAQVRSLEAERTALVQAREARPADLEPDEPLLSADSVAVLAAAVHRAAEALAEVADALDGLSGSRRHEPTSEVAGPVLPAPAPAPRPRRRTPLRLPGGVFADSAEAAIHLLRTPGVLVVVDGYNAAKLGWPDAPLPDQRERLLVALDELAARFATEVLVVFDGADVVARTVGHRHLRVSFSPPGVTADDVIVELVGSLPAEQAVVVATNDGEVREGARAAGANVISSEQLLTAARRAS